MSSDRISAWVRVLGLLFSMAAVGGLIGFGWEHASHVAASEPEDSSESLPPRNTFEPHEKPRHSPEEQRALQRALSHFPPYPRASRPEVLAVDYLGPRAPMAVAWLTTKDSPDQVLEHYARILEEKELPVIGQRYSASAGFVGYWSPESGDVHLVSVLAQSGETILFVSSGNVAAFLEGGGQVPEWLPMPSQLEQRASLMFTLEGATQYTLSGTVPLRPLDEVADAYQALLTSQGWSIGALHSGERELEFEVRRGQVQGTASLSRPIGGSDVHLFLSLMERP